MNVTEPVGALCKVLDHAKNVLQVGGYQVSEARNMRTGLGWHLRCLEGQILCLYRTGRVIARGRNSKAIKSLFDASTLVHEQLLIEASLKKKEDMLVVAALDDQP